MNDDQCRHFFTHPSCPAQRQYEALRAVFREGLSQKEAAARFGYTHGAFRHLVGQYRDEALAPFFTPSAGAARRSRACVRLRRLSLLSPPTPAP
jgi:hypothetical protein